MSSMTGRLSEPMLRFLSEMAQARETDVMARLREETSHLELARMQISPEQGQLMAVLAQMLGVTRALEVGTFTGYSALCISQVLPEDGKLVACDLSEEWTSVAQRYWQEAGVSDRIDLRLGTASETLQTMIDQGESGSYDFAFIDADKEGYDGYYEQCLTLIRSGGVITLDNAFMGGEVAETTPVHPESAIVRELLLKISKDERVDAALIPVGDGLLLARKR